MANLYLENEKQLDDYIKNNTFSYIGHGEEGVCYLLKNGYVLKKLHYPIKITDAFPFQDLNIPSFRFNKNGIIINNLVWGYFFNYVDGKNIRDVNLNDIKIDKLIYAMNILEKDFIDLSSNRVAAYDQYYQNIFWYKDSFYFIDTSRYKYLDEPSDGYLRLPFIILYRSNLLNALKTIYNESLLKLSNVKLLLDENKIDLLNLNDLFFSPAESCIKVRELLCNECQKNIETFNEAEKVLCRKK